MRQPGKIITRVIVFLLFGTIVNVAVAWACLFFEGAAATGAPHKPIGITRDFDGVLMVGFPMRALHWPKYYADLPDTVIWPGFVMNTVLYAGLVAVATAAYFGKRRERRIRCGLCPACAYPIGETPLCTECGGKLPQRNQA